MTKSKYSADLQKWVDPRIIGCFALVTSFVSTLLFISAGIGEGYFEIELCLRKGCWENFTQLFSLPIGIAVWSTKLLVAYSAAVGILVAVNNYVETKKVASSQVHLASRSNFESFIRGKLATLRHLNESNVSIHSWYSFMHPNSASGDLEINDNYLNLISRINSFTSRTDRLIISQGKGFRHDRYHGPIIEMLRSTGFDLKGCSRLEFFSYEREAFSLLNDANSVFCADRACVDLKPSEAHRIP